MTSTILSPSTLEPQSLTQRLTNVIRLHLVNRMQIIVVPWLIMGFIFTVSLIFGWSVRASWPDTREGDQFTIEFNGAVFYFFIYMLVLAVMAISQTFPFAQSYSVTRRDFFTGTALTFFGLSVAYSLVITLLGWVEDITHGWGVNVSVFDPGIFGSGIVGRFYITLVLFVFFFMIGMATASIYVRWKANGMYIFFGLLTIVAVGFIAPATVTDSWVAIIDWARATGRLGLATWTLVPSVLSLLLGYRILSRATPKD